MQGSAREEIDQKQTGKKPKKAPNVGLVERTNSWKTLLFLLGVGVSH